MKRSFPLAEVSFLAWDFLAKPRLRRQSLGLGLLVPPADSAHHLSPATRHFRPRRTGAYSLVELLIVVSIIAILAGLVLSTVGYVNRKGAASRAQTEVAALAEAIENYKLDFGNYPPPANLYAELTAGGPVNSEKVYFEPPAGMVSTNASLPVFQDPYGNPYNYSTAPTRNIGFFDLWCVPPGATNQSGWIHN